MRLPAVLALGYGASADAIRTFEAGPILIGMPASHVSPLLLKAAAHHRAGRFAHAAELYREVLAITPDDAAALLSLGTLLSQQGDNVQARPLLVRSAERTPDRPEAWMALGMVLARCRDFSGAEQAFMQAIKLRPDLAAAHVNQGNARRRLGRLTDAAESYRRGIVLDPRSAQARFNLGNLLVDTGDMDAAVAEYEAAIQLDPAYLAARTNLGNLLLRLKRNEEALRRFEEVAEADPKFPHAHHNIGVALQASRRFAAAADAYQRELEFNPDDLGTWNNLCLSLLCNARPAEALGACEDYLKRSPYNQKPLAYKAAALIELGRRDEASRLLDFERLILRHPVATPPGFASTAIFNDALAAHIQRHPTLVFEPTDKSTQGGSQTGELLVESPGPAIVLQQIIAPAVDAYMRHVRGALPWHPYVQGLPDRWRLATWAVVLKSQGYQGPHFHPDGYISGVYYVSLPPTISTGQGDAGWIEFGRTAVAIGGSQPPLLKLIRPEAGLMLLFPSYFYHRTIPFEAEEPRISVAFDILPGC